MLLTCIFSVAGLKFPNDICPNGALGGGSPSTITRHEAGLVAGLAHSVWSFSVDCRVAWTSFSAKDVSAGSHATSAGASVATGCVAALRCMNFILEIRELSKGFLTVPSTSRLDIGKVCKKASRIRGNASARCNGCQVAPIWCWETGTAEWQEVAARAWVSSTPSSAERCHLSPWEKEHHEDQAEQALIQLLQASNEGVL